MERTDLLDTSPGNSRPVVTSSIEVVIRLLEELDHMNIGYMIGGSFASSAWGQPRQTNNLDLSILLQPNDVDAL